jgi:hypothetical protein
MTAGNSQNGKDFADFVHAMAVQLQQAEMLM